MDEMHIKEYVSHLQQAHWWASWVHEIGRHNTHILKYEQSLPGKDQQTEPLAKSLFTIMVRSLFNQLQFPYAQFPCKSSGDLLYDPFWEAVSRIERFIHRILIILYCYTIIIYNVWIITDVVSRSWA